MDNILLIGELYSSLLDKSPKDIHNNHNNTCYSFKWRLISTRRSLFEINHKVDSLVY